MLLLFLCCDLDLGAMTLKLNLDLDILKMCLQTKNKVAIPARSMRTVAFLEYLIVYNRTKNQLTQSNWQNTQENRSFC